MTEAEIRTLIAKNIKEFDPTFEVIKEEFKVQMEDGHTGAIDILAKDHLGCLIIIEVKINKGSERSAIQQLFKYTAMLKNDFSVPQEKIRRVIISTDWRELKTPFAEFSSHAKYPIEGFKLTIDSGTLNFKEVIIASKDVDIDPASKFHLFKFRNEDGRNQALELLKVISESVPELNLLVYKIELNQPKSEKYFNHRDFGSGLIIKSF